MEGNIRVGTVVRLKSGGPKMVVDKLMVEDDYENPRQRWADVFCSWFAKGEHGSVMRRREIFASSTLEEA